MLKAHKRLIERALYSNGDYFVFEIDGEYTVCDVEGCSAELYHIGDSYEKLEDAKKMVNFWSSGGHWSERPDR